MTEILPPPTLDRIATYLSLPSQTITTLLTPSPETQVRDLVVQLLQKIDERAQDTADESSLRQQVEELKSQRLVDSVNHDNAVHKFQKRIKALESQLQTSQSNEEQSRSEVVRHETESKNLTIQLQSLQQTHSNCQIQLQSMQTRIQILESSSRESLSLIDRKQQNLEREEEEISSLAAKLSETKREVSRLESVVQDTKAGEMTLKFQMQTAEQEMELFKQ